MKDSDNKDIKPIEPQLEQAIEESSQRSIVPVLPLNGSIILPYTLSPLIIEGEQTIEMIQKVANGDRLIALFPILPDVMNITHSLVNQLNDVLPEEVSTLLNDLDAELPEKEEEVHEIKKGFMLGKKFHDFNISSIGVLGRIVRFLRFPDGTVRILVRGLKRVRYVSPVENQKDHLIIEDIEENVEDDIETVAMVRNAIQQFQEVLAHSKNFPEELKIAIMNLDDNSRIIDLIADALNMPFSDKLTILQEISFRARVQHLTILLNREVEVLKLGHKIQTQVHNNLSKTQREYFLREQLRMIKQELGEDKQGNPDIEAIDERMKELELPEEVVKVIEKEKERLKMIPPSSSDYHLTYNYIDWLLTTPWNVFTVDRLDINEAEKILDQDHYGLTDIKERIIEFLAVLQLKKDKKSPIICFVGPPGVGKTSLGKSIAKAMGRKFIRISLGGVRDEAEIRGHRRTYVGALPGRLIQGMKRAGSSNPVFMLDEIDKLGNDFRGDPSSALLEVLDPQQNNAFNDHYLEIDYDLSHVMFIATANLLDTIPPALLDRMEIIRLPGYTALEKRQIAQQFLIPRQLKENGIPRSKLYFTVAVINDIISSYTREAGVRNLERMIGAVCRKYARKIVTKEVDSKKRKTLTISDIRDFLGSPKFLDDEVEHKPEVGVVTGLAWTSVGGTILPIEVTMMPGKGGLKLTGSLGSVMKESAETAFSYIRSKSKKLKIKNEIFQENDFHIHVPDGATPKDGPSAGAAITTALISLLTGRPVKPFTAMTGEMTLRGKVTPIGGLKEKAIAALRAGIKTVVIPKNNKKDLVELPETVQKGIDFKLVETIDQALKIMLEK